MAHLGHLDFSYLISLSDKLSGLPDPQPIISGCANELAHRLLQLAADRTPVGQYPGSSGKVGGTLRRNWKTGEIKQSGNTVYIEVYNPVEYAPHVEYGHRTRNHKGWVNGKFMLKTSAEEVQSIADDIIREKMMEYFGGVFK